VCVCVWVGEGGGGVVFVVMIVVWLSVGLVVVAILNCCVRCWEVGG